MRRMRVAILPPLLLAITLAFTLSLADAQEEQKVRIVFYMETRPGERTKISPCEVEIIVGQTASCTVPYTNLVYHERGTRIVFRGWYSGETLISTQPTIVVTARNDSKVQEYVAKFKTQYLVEFDVGYTTIVEWKDEGSRVAYDILETWIVEEGVRRVFSRWTGDIEDNRADIFIERLTRPLKAKALWRNEYYVTVSSEYPLSVKSGWYPEGEVITVKPLTPIVDMNDGETRIIIKGFKVDYLYKELEDLEISGESVKVEVVSPLVVKAEWRKLHRVVLTSDYVTSTVIDDWFEDGSKLVIREFDREVVWENGTKAVFIEWVDGIYSPSPKLELYVDRPVRARAVWKIFYLVKVESDYPVHVDAQGWVPRGSRVTINAAPVEREVEKGVKVSFEEWRGTIVSKSPVIDIQSLDKPVTLKARWVKRFLVRVSAPPGSGADPEHWVPEKEEYEILVHKEIRLDDSTRMIFDRWLGCHISSDNLCVLKNVTAPLTVTAQYRTEKRVEFIVVTLEDEQLDDVTLEIRHKDGEVKQVSSGMPVWLKVGDWRVQRIIWRGFDVTSTTDIRLSENSPEMAKIVSRAFRASFMVRDVLGLPANGAKIVIRTRDGAILYEGWTDANGMVERAGPLPPTKLVADLYYQNNHISREFDFTVTFPIYITIPLSQTSMTIIFSTVTVIALTILVAAARAHTRRRRSAMEKSHPEVIPAQEEEAEDLEILEERKAPAVTLEEVVRKLEMSGERVEDILGELAEKVRKKKRE